MKNDIFGRINDEGTVDILYKYDGNRVTRLDANVYPVNSDFCARREHPQGIVLTLEDARSLGIEIGEE